MTVSPDGASWIAELEPARIAAVLGLASAAEVTVFVSGARSTRGATPDRAAVLVVEALGLHDVGAGVRAAEAVMSRGTDLWVAYPARSQRSYPWWAHFVEAVRACEREPVACVNIDAFWAAALTTPAARRVPRLSRALRIAQRHAST